MNPKFKKWFHDFVIYLILAVVSLVVLLPMIGVLFSAFKTESEYFTTSRLMPPADFFNFDNFVEIFLKGKLVEGFLNTLIVIAGALLAATLFNTMVAYVLARFEFKGKVLIRSLYLVASFVPSVTTQIVTFNIVKSMGLINSLGAPILLYAGVDIVTLYIYLQFIGEIPRSLDEAALLEGCSYTGIYLRVILPMLTPAILTTCIIKGTSIYNDFYTAFLYLPSKSKPVMSTMLYRFMGPYSSQWNVIAAGILIVIIPIFVVFVFLQKYIYRGFAAGAIK